MNSIKYKWRHWIGSNLPLYCAVIWIAFCIIFNKAKEVGPYLYVSGKARRLFVDQILYAQVKTINIISDLVITWQGHVIHIRSCQAQAHATDPNSSSSRMLRTLPATRREWCWSCFCVHIMSGDQNTVKSFSGDPRSYFQRKIRNNSQVLHDHVIYQEERLSRPQHSTATSRPTIQIQSSSRTLK